MEEDVIFIADGVSGAPLVRPAVDALRDRAAAGELDRGLLGSPDRLARKEAQQLILGEEFPKRGVERGVINRELSATPEDQLFLQIQGVISAEEREKIGESSRRGKLPKAPTGKGKVWSGAPYGYGSIPASDGEEAREEIYAAEAKSGRRMFPRLVYQQRSIGALARKLPAENVPTRTPSGQWERSVGWGVLRNPASRGKAA